MGNICGKQQQNIIAYYSDKQAIETWLPGLVHLFNYDTKGLIISLNSTFFGGNVLLVRDQLTSLLTLLRGRSGISNTTLDTIQNLLSKLSTTPPSMSGRMGASPPRDDFPSTSNPSGHPETSEVSSRTTQQV